MNSNPSIEWLQDLQNQLEALWQNLNRLQQEYNQAKASFESLDASSNDPAIIRQRQEAGELFRRTETALNNEHQSLINLQGQYQQATNACQAALKRVREEQDTAFNISHTAEGVTKGTTELSEAYGSLMKVMSLCGIETEKMSVIQEQLNNIITVTATVQKVSGLLSTQSAFQTQVVARVTSAWGTAQTFLNTQLGISIGLSKALMAGGIGILIAGIGILINQYQKWRKNQEETARLNSIVTDSIKNATHEGKKNAAAETSRLNLLYNATQDINRSLQDRKKAAGELQKMYPAYFGSLGQEQILAGKGKEAYDKLSESILATAKARAYAEKITGNYKRIIEIETLIADKNKEKENQEQLRAKTSQLSYDYYSPSQSAFVSQQHGGIESKIKNLNSEISTLNSESDKLKEANTILAKNIEIADLITQKETPSLNQDPEKDARVEYEKKVGDLLLSTHLENRQREINLMKDGAEKKRKQIELDYEKEIAGIVQTINTVSKENNGILPAFLRIPFIIKIGLATQKKENDLNAVGGQEKQELDALLAQYQDFTTQRFELEKKFKKDKEKLSGELGKNENQQRQEEIKRALEQLDKNHQVELEKINDTEIEFLGNNSDAFAKIFGIAADTSKKRINESINLAKQLYDYLKDVPDAVVPEGFDENQLQSMKENPELIRKLYSSIIESQAILDKHTKYPFSGIINGFKDFKKSAELTEEALKKTGKEKEKLLDQSDKLKSNGLASIKAGAGEAADALKLVSDSFMELAKASGDERLMEQAEQFGAFAQNLGAAAKGFQQGGLVGAIVGGATDFISQTVSAFATSSAEEKELEQNRLDFLAKYNLALLEIKKEDYDGIFGSRELEKARDAATKAEEALKQYKDTLAKRSELNEKKEFNSLGGAIFGMGAPSLTNFLGFGRSISNETKTLQAAYKKGYTDLQAMAVKTKDYSGWANFWGKKDKYTSLKDLAPQLWNGGEFDISAAKAFLETNTQINDEQRKQIQNVIDLNEAYEENIKLIDEQLTKVFGTLTTDITNAIYESVRNGADAWDLFEDAGLKVIDALGKQLIQEMYVQSYLDRYRDKMRAAYQLESPEATQKELSNIMRDIYGGLGAVLDGASAAAIEWDKMAREKGFNIDKLYNQDEQNTDQQPSSRGFETMSQETATELDGRFTALQMAGEQIKLESTMQTQLLTASNTRLSEIYTLNTDMLRVADDTRDTIVNSYLELQEIRENTGAIVKPIKEMVTEIKEIKNNTSKL